MVLFDSTHAGTRALITDQAYDFLEIVPSTDPLPAHVQRLSSDRNYYWDDPVDRLRRAGLRLSFIEFFDWDQFGYLDLELVRVRIAACAEHPELAGRQALIRPQYASILLHD